MFYPLVQYGCDNCGALTEVLDPDQPLPKGWTYGDGHHTHYCPKCSNKKNNHRGLSLRLDKTLDDLSYEESDKVIVQIRKK